MLFFCFLSCSNNENLKEVDPPKKSLISSGNNSEIEIWDVITPTQNETIITKGICDVIEGDTTIVEFINGYIQLLDIDYEIVTTQTQDELYQSYLNAYYNARSSISDINDEDELLEYFQTNINGSYSDSFYEALVDLVTTTCTDGNYSIDYSQFLTEEAYLLSYAVSLSKSMRYFASTFMQVAEANTSASECWNNLWDEMVELVGWSTAGAITTGIAAAGASFLTGGLPAILLGVSSVLNGTATTIQLYRNVKAIYRRYANCMESVQAMQNSGIIIDIENEGNNGTYDENDDWTNWETFLGCQVIRPYVHHGQYVACMDFLLGIQ